MPELAEVEFYRKQWNPGLRNRVLSVEVHSATRVYRDADAKALRQALRGGRLLSSEAHGKRMVFRFSSHRWLGIHLGMTGGLRIEPPGYIPGRHDHLVLRQAERALVFSDPRQFGRVLFHVGKDKPDWWSDLPPSLISDEFTLDLMNNFLRRHGKLSVKAALLLQDGFPGIGNWMADEILWQTGLEPSLPCHRLTGAHQRAFWRRIRFVCRGALKTVGRDWSDPPRGWLFHERWSGKGQCPKHGAALRRDTIGGRTTVWCARCQG